MSIPLERSDKVQFRVWDKPTPPQVDFTDVPKTNNHTLLQFRKTPLLHIKHFLKRYWTKIIENYILGEVNTTPTAPTRPTTLPCCSLLIKICFIQLLYNVLKKYWIVSIVLVMLWHNLYMSAALTRCMVKKNQSADWTFPAPTHFERRGQSSSSLFFYSNLWLDVVLIRTPFVCCSISPPPFFSKLYFLCSLAIWICLRYV